MSTDTATASLPVNNALYVRRRGKILLPATGDDTPAPLNFAASALKNVEALGYTFTPALLAACQSLPLAQLTALHNELIADLARLRGAHQTFKPFYPNFPQQVMEMPPARLYLNALLHYWSGGKFRRPESEKKERPPLQGETDFTPLDLGTRDEFEGLLGLIAGSNTSLSEQDKEDLTWFVSAYGDQVGALLPESVPQKENMAFLASLLLTHTSGEKASEFIARYCKTATDVLRLAVALSGGDVSLATASKFRTFKRAERVLLLSLLEKLKNPTEDMLRWKSRWIRLGEKLHPGEYKTRFGRTAEAFQVLRDDLPFTTFNGGIEKALAGKDVTGALKRIATRPGEMARRLDHLLRLDPGAQGDVVPAFEDVAHEVSTPVLLQVRQHFAMRGCNSKLRVFFPKGNVGKAQGVANLLPGLPDAITAQVVSICEAALRARFGALESLGAVYVDPELANYPAPFAMRSASKALRTLVRGSRLPLEGGDTVRFFIWWKNGNDRTDIDLSAAMFTGEFEYGDVVSYYNLKNFGGVHSGDIVDAPDGASEFIDLSLSKVRAAGMRYIIMSLNSYSGQRYVELPECFAGWMMREDAGSGEIYEPRTVRDRLDVTADTKIAIPLVIDVVERQVIWCDMALTRNPRWVNNVAGNVSGMGVTLRAFVDLNKPNLYDLFRLHGEARGHLVATPDEAETVFSVAAGTPFRIEETAANYMA